MSWQGDRILQVARRYPSHDAKQLVAWRLEEAEYDRLARRGHGGSDGRHAVHPDAGGLRSLAVQ
jgi:hypothetical protein